MLRPLHQWKLKKDGTPARDSHGYRIPHPKMGQAKKDSELTPEERERRDEQLMMAEVRAHAHVQSSKLVQLIESL